MSKSNIIVSTREPFTTALEPTGTFKISTDFEQWLDIEISDPVSFVLKNTTQLERFKITATWWVATIVKRGLTQGNTPVEDVSLRKPWGDWEIWYITSLAFNQFDLQDDNTIPDGNKIQFWGSNAYVFTDDDGANLKFKDDANSEKTLSELSAAGSDEKVSVTTNDTTPWFIDTKVTTGDWLTGTVVNPAWNESFDIDIDTSDTTIFVKTSAGAWDEDKAPILDANGKLAPWFMNWQYQSADESTEGVVFRASDAEALAWVEETKFINSKQVKDNYEQVQEVILFTKIMTDVAWDQVIAHNLWKVPKLIQFDMLDDADAYHSKWAYDGTNNRCLFANASDTNIDNTNAIYFTTNVWSPNVTFQRAPVTAVTDTDFTLTWAKWSSPTGTFNIIAILTA